MSETTDPIASAMATMDAADSAQHQDSAPQAEQTAESPAEQTAPPASAEDTQDAEQHDAAETNSRSAKRIQQLLQREREAREEAAYYKGLADRQKPQEQQPAQAPKLSQDLAQWVGEEPKPDAFPAGEFDPQYLRAVARFEARHEQAQMAMVQRQQAARHAEAAKAQAFAKAAAEVAKEHNDFNEVVGGLGHRLPNVVADMIAEAGAEVAYAIGKDEAAEARIRAATSPAAVAREIGRIEARLEAAKEAAKAAAQAPPPQPSAAPPPPSRTVRGHSPARGFDYATADIADIQARLNQKR